MFYKNSVNTKKQNVQPHRIFALEYKKSIHKQIFMGIKNEAKSKQLAS